jgi:predicted lactoylglutathione lyase
MRELLIDAIINLSGDEYESIDDVIELAKESENELVERLIGIACFYRDEFNDVNQ